MSSNLSKDLRKVIRDIRRKPYPIKDLIPLLQQAADQLDHLPQKKKDVCHDFGRCNCLPNHCEYGLRT